MKKNEIDKLFAERMAQDEMKPRPEAWAKLESKLNQKKHRIGWFQYGSWLAAASVVLFMIGFSFWNNKPNIDTQVAVNQDNKILSNGKQSVKTQTEEESDKILSNGKQPVKTQTEEEIPRYARNDKANTQNDKANTRNDKANTQNDKALATIQTANKKTIKQKNNNVEVAQNQASIKEVQPVQEPKPRLELVPKIELPKTEAIAALPTTPKEKVVVMQLPEVVLENSVAVVSGNNNELNTTKKSRLGKFFKQLKNLKNGEKIEWDEVGVNPNKILARANKTIEKEEN